MRKKRVSRLKALKAHFNGHRVDYAVLSAGLALFGFAVCSKLTGTPDSAVILSRSSEGSAVAYLIDGANGEISVEGVDFLKQCNQKFPCQEVSDLYPIALAAEKRGLMDRAIAVYAENYNKINGSYRTGAMSPPEIFETYDQLNRMAGGLQGILSAAEMMMGKASQQSDGVLSVLPQEAVEEIRDLLQDIEAWRLKDMLRKAYSGFEGRRREAYAAGKGYIVE